MNRHFGDTTRLQSCLDRWRQGDDSARNDLLESVQRRLYQLARKMLQGFPRVRRYVEADDVVQEVSRRLLVALNDVHPASASDFMAWVACRINWQLLEWAKKYRRYKSEPNGSTLPIDPPAKTSGPATLAQWTEFHKAIEKLPDEHRRYFELIYYGGLTVKDAAEVLSVSYGTAKKGWLDARLALCRKLHVSSNSQALPLRRKAKL